jgi:hypothetical protein
MLWVDPTDPEVFAAVAGVELDGPIPEVELAVASQAVGIASEILTLATAYLIHPAGEQTEESVTRRLRRWSPVYQPLTAVTKLVRVADDGTETPLTYRRVGGMLLVGAANSYEVPLWRTNWADGGREALYRLTYTFGSTLTTTARAMILHYARQFYVWLGDTDDECELPENVTSITREGLGIELATPQDFLDRGRTGLAKIDSWLAQVNAKRALRPAGVYTPDSPPGIGVGLRRLS